MDDIIAFVTGVLVLLYIGVAVWKIWTCRTVSGGILTSFGFLLGGCVILPAAYYLTTIVCWAVVIGIALAVIGAIFG